MDDSFVDTVMVDFLAFLQKSKLAADISFKTNTKNLKAESYCSFQVLPLRQIKLPQFKP